MRVVVLLLCCVIPAPASAAVLIALAPIAAWVERPVPEPPAFLDYRREVRAVPPVGIASPAATTGALGGFAQWLRSLVAR